MACSSRVSGVPEEPDPSPWSVDYTEQPSDTVVKLKSFIKQNLRSSNDSFHSTGSSDDNLSEVELTADQRRMYQQYNNTTERVQTPEPKPLTTTNVTLHDQIWSSDVGSSSQSSDVKCRKLLRSSSEDLTDDKPNNRKQRTYFDSGSERSCDSQDTMILTVTDNQSHTYAFHNRISPRDGTINSNTELIDIPPEMESDCIPIRRGTTLPDSQEMKYPETQPFDDTSQRTVSSNMSLYAPKPFTSNLQKTTATKPKSKKNLKVSFAEPLHFDEPPAAALRSRLEEDGDDGYGSTDNLSSETCSSNSSILNGAANPYQRPPLVHSRVRIQDNQVRPASTRVASTDRSEEVTVTEKPPVKVKPRLLPKPKGNQIRQQSNREKENEPSFKTNYGYVRLQRVPSFRKMNQDLRRQKDQAQGDNNQVTNPSTAAKADIEAKDSTLQRKLKALCIVDERKPDVTEDETSAIGPGGLYNQEGNPSAAYKQGGRSTGHHQRTNSYEAAINEPMRPSQVESVDMQNPSNAKNLHNQENIRPQSRGDNTNNYSGANSIDFVDGYYFYDNEEPPKRYTYDQNAVPTKGILKKSKNAPQISYSFDSYDQERGFAISVHDQSQGQVQGQGSSQDFFPAASSIPQSVIPEYGEYQGTLFGENFGETEIRKEAQMEAEMNGLYGYQPSRESDSQVQVSNPTPVHKIMLENERYRNLYNSSPSAQFLMEASQFAGDSYDTSDTLHRRQLRKATEQFYGRSSSLDRCPSPHVTVRTRSPSPQLNLRTRSPSPQRMNQLTAKPGRTRSHSPSLRYAAEAQSFSRMVHLDHSSMSSGSFEQENEQVPGINPLHRADSVNSTASSSASIYERYNMPLDNALLYKTNAAPNIRAQSPGGNSDTSTNVDSGFNDTFEGAIPTDGTRNKDGSTPFDTNVNRLQRAIKEGNRILSSTGLHILSSHKQQMDNEYSKYLKLLNQVQRQQKEHRRTSAPVISGAENLGAFSSNRQQPMKAQFVKTADLYKMMEQQRRPPTPPVSK